ncbi:MAG: hypothetical protein A2600_09595 [Candidatus Lambdaproteobacteria bacterium RIFOXYD1_FULL_56_27]|nr:MAG: hypothetical protein A2600_09595 [Candidatus Lambdaproteobacteria bacterium RIFOXYD1_FULL_56_27]
MNLRLLTLLFALLVPHWAFAGYTDPELKVLVFSGLEAYSLSARGGMTVKGVELEGPLTKIEVTPEGRGVVNYGGYQRTRSVVYLYPKGEITLKRHGHRPKRYEGFMELVPHKGGVYLINHVPVESYLEGVLGGEIKTSWAMEAVKAQAVIARTYALYRRHERRNSLWHLKSGTADQMYLGKGVSDPRARQAIEKTRGVVVSYQGHLAMTYYHSNCGGVTEDPGTLWDFSLPYYPTTEVPFGSEDPRYFWETQVSPAQLSEVLAQAGLAPDEVESLEIGQRTPSGRAFELILTGQKRQVILARDFRRLVGYEKLPSLLFEVSPSESGFVINGQGNGHGVGLCQWAAKEMAEKNYRYQDILAFFYRPTDLGYYNE